MAEINTDIKLKASVSRIVKWEQKTGKSIMTAFSGDRIDLTTIVQLVGELAEPKTSDAQIDAYVEKNGFESLMQLVMEALVESGFLPKDALNQLNK